MTRLLISEPAGTRELEWPCRIGGLGSDIVVPGAGGDTDVVMTFEQGELWQRAASSENAAQAPRSLEPGDVFQVGDAAVRIDIVSSPLVQLSVIHQVGNATLEPFSVSTSPPEDSTDQPVTIAPVVSSRSALAAPVAVQTRWRMGLGIAAAGIALFLGAISLAAWQPVQLVVTPAEAQVRGSGLSWRAADTLFVWPGERTITASLEGHETVRRTVTVEKDVPLRVDLRLPPLPGILLIDTGGVVGTVYVDGAEVGRVPGEVSVMGGERTLRIQADRHLDVIERISVTGRGVRQALVLKPQPSWGRLEVSSTTAEARIRLDDDRNTPARPLPVTLELPAGVHRLTIDAPGAKPWQSTVLVRGGMTERIGPVVLGVPDAVLRITSKPSGADVSIGGAFRGRTPLTVDVSPAMEHAVTMTLQGYRSAERRVRAESGRRQEISATLQAIPVSLTLRGEPAGAEVLIDGTVRGITPLTLELPARRQIVELRRTGSEPRRLDIDLSTAEARTVEYRLVPAGRPADWKPPPALWRAQSGATLRLVTGGEFLAGSDRREQGRRANEFQRRVTLSRPFYIGTREVTNGEFRRFKPGHSSGFVGRRTLDLDGFSVTNVSWAEAVQYCNWLSQQDGLPPAYEQQGGQWVLKQPATTGYRLPSEAEWEYVTRHARGAKTQRYEWGDALPPPPSVANLAGRESAAELPRILEDWQDDYEVVGPPGRFPANGLGLFDLTGNVAEWVHDVYASFDGGAAVTDPLGPAPAAGSRRVVKGSHWRTASYAELRAAWRDARLEASQDIGFRVARYAE